MTNTKEKTGNMENKKRIDPDYVPDEKKVWRPVSLTPCDPPTGKPAGLYFMGIEELQGAWVGEGEDKYWEEAECGTVEFEIPTPDDLKRDYPGIGDFVTKRVEVLRARRYVIKRFEPNGKVKNAFDGAYSGPRKWS